MPSMERGLLRTSRAIEGHQPCRVTVTTTQANAGDKQRKHCVKDKANCDRMMEPMTAAAPTSLGRQVVGLECLKLPARLLVCSFCTCQSTACANQCLLKALDLTSARKNTSLSNPSIEGGPIFVKEGLVIIGRIVLKEGRTAQYSTRGHKKGDTDKRCHIQTLLSLKGTVFEDTWWRCQYMPSTEDTLKGGG
ncbi:uncharacterized protein LOC142793736 [Rhipicephalus microplus]|uniref:uncharacterized protein LOC142790026 n=1 Tax=Rhipicephalus microplus TaxID=6941 RepID=UPI003F6BCE53